LLYAAGTRIESDAIQFNDSVTLLGGGNVVTNGQASAKFSGVTTADTVVVTGTITSSVMGCTALTLPGTNAIKAVTGFPLSGLATNTYEAGDMLRFNGTNWVGLNGGIYVPRTNDLSAADFTAVNFVTNTTTNCWLDLSSVVPAGIRAVQVRLQVSSTTSVGHTLRLFPAANTNIFIAIAAKTSWNFGTRESPF
jgi:hypothetical protein